MKKLDKKDQPKLIALIVLSLGAFVFALMQLAPSTKASSKPTGAAAKDGGAATGAGRQAGAASGAGAAGTSTAGSAPTTFDAGDIAILTSGKDPFVPNGTAAAPADGGSSTTAAPSAPAKKSSPAPSVAVTSAGSRQGPKIEEMFGGRPPRGGGDAPASGPVPTVPAPPVAPPPPPPALVVTGIVRGLGNEQGGTDDVAILRGSSGGATSSDGKDAPAGGDIVGEQRLFVRVGDAVGNGFTVVAVHRDGVEIASGRRRIILKLGEDSRAK